MNPSDLQSLAYYDIEQLELAARRSKQGIMLFNGKVIRLDDGYWTVNGSYAQNDWEFSRALRIALTL